MDFKEWWEEIWPNSPNQLAIFDSTLSHEAAWNAGRKQAFLEAAERIAELEAENKQLKERLEISPNHGVDGIAARDTTIRMLEDGIKEMREQRDRLAESLCSEFPWSEHGY